MCYFFPLSPHYSESDQLNSTSYQISDSQSFFEVNIKLTVHKYCHVYSLSLSQISTVQKQIIVAWLVLNSNFSFVRSLTRALLGEDYRPLNNYEYLVISRCSFLEKYNFFPDFFFKNTNSLDFDL